MIICVIAVAFASLICYASCVVSADADRRAEQMYERWRKGYKMSDLIKREDAIKAIHNYWKKRLDTLPTKESEYGEVYADIQQIDKILEHNRTLCNFIKAIPSADRPPGEWVDAEIPLESGDTMPIQVCNLCKTFYPLAYTGGGHRFCPNCGARMLAKDTNVPNKKGADDE